MKNEEVTYHIDGIDYYAHEFTERPFILPEDIVKTAAWIFGIVIGLALLGTVIPKDWHEYVGLVLGSVIEFVLLVAVLRFFGFARK